MKRICCSFLLTVSLMVTIFAQQPPGTEIYLIDLTIKKSSVQLSNPQNITNRVGYDNQPNFHPDKPLMFYSSANTEGKTDIIEYNISTKATRHITTTSEREYSPTVTPDKNFLSCIIQRDNGTQDLGKYPMEGGAPSILINTLKVGYHAWINPHILLLFVLGDTLTLRTYDLVSNKDVILVKNIGRSLHKVPNSSEMSFVHKVSTEEWLIKKINADGTIEPLTPTLPGREDLTWTPDGKILMSDGKRFFYYQPGKTSSWQEIEMPISMPSGAITRLAVNSKGNTLAIVVTE